MYSSVLVETYVDHVIEIWEMNHQGLVDPEREHKESQKKELTGWFTVIVIKT